jgi:cytochrome c
MLPLSRLPVLLAICSLSGAAWAAAGLAPEFGTPATQADIARDISIPPNGAGLPPGHGDAARGKQVYADQCAACHGDKLQGIAATGGPALIGGRGTLATATPVKTVESYWPYATTVFDYVRRAMPFNAPGSLSNADVYAVTAYILASGHVIPNSEVVDAKSLPKVKMPNRDGFIVDPRPK